MASGGILYKMLFAIVLFFGVSWAQRPNNASICDYYAIQSYGSNSSDTQFQLMQSVIALAFGGGAGIANVSSDITGILNPGSFQGQTVDLQPWFNGSIDSTNLNNQPVGVDWLDGGGIQPLRSFLNGDTPNVVILNNTNEYHLFSHFFNSFSHIFGCSQPKPQPKDNSGFLSLAYVHKYMNLNYTDLGHFIEQLTLSMKHFGFSDQDSQTLSNQLNAQYNVRCAPAVTLNPALGPQLYSLCQADSCPLAAPSPDCAAYVDLGPSGVKSGAPSTASSTTNFSPSAVSPLISSTSTTSTSTQASTSAASAQTSSAAPVASSSSSSLSVGGIAGVSIASTALIFTFIGTIVFLLRRKTRTDPYIPSSVYAAPSYTDQHTSYTSRVDRWNRTPIAEMESPESPRHMGIPEMIQVPRLQQTFFHEE